MKKMKKTAENNINQRDSAQVYDKAAVDFRQKAPELLTYKYIVRPVIEASLDRFIPTDRDKKMVFDIGSASGRNVHTLVQEGFLAKNIFGVEISSEQVEIARREIPEATFEVGDISNYHLTPNSYDLAIMVMVPEFLDEGKYPAALANIRSSMKNKGTFIYITTHPDRYKAKYGVTSGEVTTKGPWSDDNFSNYVRSTRDQLDALKRAGFYVETFMDFAIPEEVEEADRERRAQFTHPEAFARLLIVATAS